MEHDSEIISKGIGLAKNGLYTAALNTFDQSLEFAQDPTAMSYYAMSIAAAEGDHDRAVSLCLVAAEQAFYIPDIYLNLGKIFLINGQKSTAIKTFQKGLSYDTSGGMLMSALNELGLRRKRVIVFLPRQNMINRFLGKLMHGRQG